MYLDAFALEVKSREMNWHYLV